MIRDFLAQHGVSYTPSGEGGAEEESSAPPPPAASRRKASAARAAPARTPKARRR